MLTKWLNAVKNYKTTWPYLVLAGLVVGVPIAVGLGIGFAVAELVHSVLTAKYGNSLRLPGDSGDLRDGIAVIAWCAAGAVVALVLAFVLYRLGLPYARKYAQMAAERAAMAAEQPTVPGASPIGHPTGGQPSYPIVGYPPAGHPVTADRAVGVAPPASGTNGLAVASFVTAFVIPLVGAVLGFVARSQIRRTGQDGGGLALAGIIIGTVSTVASTVVVMVILAILFGGIRIPV